MCKWFLFIFLMSGVTLTGFSTVAAGDQPAGVAGKWQLSWQGRLGTEQVIVELQQDGAKLSGIFQEPRGSFLLSGAVTGKDISFTVEFKGRHPYTIAFKGTLDGGRMTGTSKAENVDGGAYLGHGGEIVQSDHPWTASRLPDQPPPKRAAQSSQPGSAKQ